MAPITSSDSLGITVLVLIVVFSVLTSLAVWGRFWSRSAKKIAPAANDHAILIALVGHQLFFSSISCIGSQMLLSQVFTWGMTILNVVGCTAAAYGQHEQFVTNRELVILAKVSQIQVNLTERQKVD